MWVFWIAKWLLAFPIVAAGSLIQGFSRPVVPVEPWFRPTMTRQAILIALAVTTLIVAAGRRHNPLPVIWLLVGLFLVVGSYAAIIATSMIDFWPKTLGLLGAIVAAIWIARMQEGAEGNAKA